MNLTTLLDLLGSLLLVAALGVALALVHPALGLAAAGAALLALSWFVDARTPRRKDRR